MGRFFTALTILAVAAAVFLIAVGIRSIATSKSRVEERMSESKSPSPDREAPTRLPFFSTNARPLRTLPSNKIAQSAPATATNLITDWEDKLDDVLGSEGQDTDKARQMLAMFPRLSEDAPVEV